MYCNAASGILADPPPPPPPHPPPAPPPPPAHSKKNFKIHNINQRVYLAGGRISSHWHEAAVKRQQAVMKEAIDVWIDCSSTAGAGQGQGRCSSGLGEAQVRSNALWPGQVHVRVRAGQVQSGQDRCGQGRCINRCSEVRSGSVRAGALAGNRFRLLLLLLLLLLPRMFHLSVFT